MLDRKALRENANIKCAKGEGYDFLFIEPSTILELLDMVDEMEKALEFYANNNGSLWTDAGGRKAREALKKIRGET